MPHVPDGPGARGWRWSESRQPGLLSYTCIPLVATFTGNHPVTSFPRSRPCCPDAATAYPAPGKLPAERMPEHHRRRLDAQYHLVPEPAAASLQRAEGGYPGDIRQGAHRSPEEARERGSRAAPGPSNLSAQRRVQPVFARAGAEAGDRGHSRGRSPPQGSGAAGRVSPPASSPAAQNQALASFHSVAPHSMTSMTSSMRRM